VPPLPAPTEATAIHERLRRAPRDRRSEELDVRYEALAILQGFLVGRGGGLGAAEIRFDRR